MKDGQSYVDSVNANPLPSDLFIELLQVAMSAMRGQRREIPPDAERCFEDAPPNSLHLTDIPENQMGMAVIVECKKRFPDDDDKAAAVSQSFLFRWFAICEERENGRIAEFIKPGEGGSEMINSAVFEVAADCPLNSEGHFDKSYLPRVRKLIADNPD